MVLAIASSRRCFRCSSVALIFAISYTCLRLTAPTVSWPGRPVPFSMLAAFFRKYETVGVLVTKVKVRSGWMVIIVGIGVPGEMWAVRALNSLQKSIDLTPRAPRAGPTGGVGAAFPAAMRRRCEPKVELRVRSELWVNVTRTTNCGLVARALDIVLLPKSTTEQTPGQGWDGHARSRDHVDNGWTPRSASSFWIDSPLTMNYPTRWATRFCLEFVIPFFVVPSQWSFDHWSLAKATSLLTTIKITVYSAHKH